jgi:hypothetical protein
MRFETFLYELRRIFRNMCILRSEFISADRNTKIDWINDNVLSLIVDVSPIIASHTDDENEKLFAVLISNIP